METAAELVRRARQRLGLSRSALAEKAQVPTSTVTRVESGKVDPTVGMLSRLLDAAGQDLHVASRRRMVKRGPVLAELTNAWIDSPDGRPDWTRLRSCLDYLATHPNEVGPALLRRPARSQSPVLDSLLAGMAEKLADDAGLSRPRWARRTPRLEQEWSAFGTPRMMAGWRAATPPQLLQRGLVIDAPSLWRDPETVGV
jgi:transcriptional regulator with XRE-family HTH domain